jgi:hypothetical protein
MVRYLDKNESSLCFYTRNQGLGAATAALRETSKTGIRGTFEDFKPFRVHRQNFDSRLRALMPSSFQAFAKCIIRGGF